MQEVLDLMGKYEKIQNKYKRSHEDKLKRQIKLTYQIEDEQKIDEILNDPNFQEEKLISGFFLGKATQQTINAQYNEIKETRDDLQNLSLSMSELQSMFQGFIFLFYNIFGF